MFPITAYERKNLLELVAITFNIRN